MADQGKQAIGRLSLFIPGFSIHGHTATPFPAAVVVNFPAVGPEATEKRSSVDRRLGGGPLSSRIRRPWPSGLSEGVAVG
jgi:hypothetical protein